MTNKERSVDDTVAWYCATCFKFDYKGTEEAFATPEHIPYRGADIGTCKGKMIALRLKDEGTK